MAKKKPAPVRPEDATAVAVKSIEAFLGYSGLDHAHQTAALLMVLRRDFRRWTKDLPPADLREAEELFRRTVEDGLLFKG